MTTAAAMFQADLLADAVNLAGSVSLKSSPRPILQKVQIRFRSDQIGAEIRAHGAGDEFTTVIPMESAWDAPDAAVVVALDRLGRLLGLLGKAAVAVIPGDSIAEIRGPRGIWKLSAEDPALFPAAQAVPATTQGFSIPGAALAAALEATAWLATDSKNWALDGVMVETDAAAQAVRLIATDSRSLAVFDEPATVVGPVVQTPVIPARAAGLFCRAFSTAETVDIRFDAIGEGSIHSSVSLDVAQMRYTSPLAAGRFPPWRKIIPTGTRAAWTCSAQEFLNAAKQAMAMVADAESLNVRLTVDLLGIHLSDEGTSFDVAIPFLSGPVGGLDVFLSSKVLAKAANVAARLGDELTLHYGDHGTALEIQSPAGWRFFTMPWTTKGNTK